MLGPQKMIIAFKFVTFSTETHQLLNTHWERRDTKIGRISWKLRYGYATVGWFAPALEKPETGY